MVYILHCKALYGLDITNYGISPKRMPRQLKFTHDFMLIIIDILIHWLLVKMFSFFYLMTLWETALSYTTTKFTIRHTKYMQIRCSASMVHLKVGTCKVFNIEAPVRRIIDTVHLVGVFVFSKWDLEFFSWYRHIASTVHLVVSQMRFRAFLEI